MLNLKSTRAPATYEADMAPIFAHKLRNFESFETFGSKKSALSSAAFAISFAASTRPVLLALLSSNTRFDWLY